MTSSVTVYPCMRSASLTFVVDTYAFEGMADTTALVLYKVDTSNQDKVDRTKSTHLCWRRIVLLEILLRKYGGFVDCRWALYTCKSIPLCSENVGCL